MAYEHNLGGSRACDSQKERVGKKERKKKRGPAGRGGIAATQKKRRERERGDWRKGQLNPVEKRQKGARKKRR